MDNLILTYRRRILKAALLRHQRKTGSTCIVISLPKGGMTTLELTEIVMDGLLSRFEKEINSEFGSTEGNKFLREIYRGAVDVNGSGEFLTESGKLIIDELLNELVQFAKSRSMQGEKP
ncbi:hypothetical protein [Kosakonia radicincitans]|uniref:hypothetical protein n=1 Tax=Kosakonia radicincitans TaxID=283686 RepID=UPI001D076A8C|nr:hypothetical protein [Kosakonia radicincitans]